MRSPIVKIILAFLCSVLSCQLLDFSNSTILESSFILSTSIEIFGVALAVTAIFFTVIDRYKDKHDNAANIEKNCYPILKEMCENVLGILIFVIVIFIVSIIEIPIDSISLPKPIQKVSLATCIYLFSFIIVLLIVYDITNSILELTKKLFLYNSDESSIDNDKCTAFVKLCKELDKEHFSELLKYTETLVVKQELKKNNECSKK